MPNTPFSLLHLARRPRPLALKDVLRLAPSQVHLQMASDRILLRIGSIFAANLVGCSSEGQGHATGMNTRSSSSLPDQNAHSAYPASLKAMRTIPRAPIVAANYEKQRRTIRDGIPPLTSVYLAFPSLIEEEKGILRAIGNLCRQGL